MGDFRFAVTAVRLVVSCAHRQHEIPRMALALSHQEAAVLSLLCQQFLGLPARQVSVEPPERKQSNISFCKRSNSQDVLEAWTCNQQVSVLLRAGLFCGQAALTSSAELMMLRSRRTRRAHN